MKHDPADFGGLLWRAVWAARRRGEDWERLASRMPGPVLRRLRQEFFWQAHGGQGEPGGDWRVWLLMAGRGFGKTLAGAQWVSARAGEARDAQIALVGASSAEVARVMIEGPSGLIAVAEAAGEEVKWVPTRGICASRAERRRSSIRGRRGTS